MVAFNRRSIQNPIANCQIIFEKCSFRSDHHPQHRFHVPRSNNHSVCSRWLDDAKQCPVTNASCGRGDRGIFVPAIYLLTSHEKKHQPFSLSGVRFGSRPILISWWKSASSWTGQKWAFHPCLLLITYGNSQRKTHQIAQIHYSEPQKRQYTATEVLLHLVWVLT